MRIIRSRNRDIVGYLHGMNRSESSSVTQPPALSIVASPTKRLQILDLAVEAENRGFPALACPTLGGALGLCVSLAHVTHHIRFYTAIQGIYGTAVPEIGSLASHVHEVSAGRFALGLGVSHESMVRRLGVSMGPPLSDMRTFIEALRSNEKYGGPLPPIYVAALRNKMLHLAIELARGALWANASFDYTSTQVDAISEHVKSTGFHLANMIPTVISDDKATAAAINRKTMSVYVRLPNYRNYWKAAGYAEEMNAIEAAIAAGNTSDHAHLMSDRWLTDCTLYGSAAEVREGFERWREKGVEPIAVMSSTSGGQLKAINELFAIYS